ncbi:MAG: hypothetical protein AAFZ07_16985 [Actinomycetota bacterium]
MSLVIVAGLFALGLVAARYRALWLGAVAIAFVLAVRNWVDGAYDDSGGELYFSIMGVIVVLVPVALGALAGRWALARRASSSAGPSRSTR